MTAFAEDLTAMPRLRPAADWHQAGIRRLGCLQRQVLSLQEALAKHSRLPESRPYVELNIRPTSTHPSRRNQ